MADIPLDKAELARRFAAETDAIALGGAAPDCAEQLAAFHAWFDAECARLLACSTEVEDASRLGDDV